ncbi:ATP-binding protein [Corallococcus sp. BB11-1]|uniref:sensor histidine kinase n=1 Tax=Corallococcus sp. BB11-1 TaxID=2996783 RepID=UPI00226D75F2|nr:ATP-binding protein [Corallococcus sp. BB11-1]MCY1035375.1 ATP-binding protein [Corallococcus sp. BB11-1]
MLVFVPESTTVPAIADFTQSLRRTVLAEQHGGVTVDVESLDMAWFGGAEYERALRDFYLVKYRQQRPDALVSFVDATPFAAYLQQQLWPDMPLLCVFNDDFLIATVTQGPYLRANWADLDVTGTVQLALRLLPDTRHVALIVGSSQRELAAWSFLSREVRAAAPGRDFINLTNLTLEQLRQRVRTLPEDTVVIIVGYMQDAAGRSLITRDVTHLLHTEGSPPLFSVHKTMLGSGIVGGMLLDYELLGQKVARRALRLLEGERASDLPPGDLKANVAAFDERELKRWSIPESRLPAGSRVMFHEPGLWERYRWQMTSILAAGLMKGALIIVLLLERRRRWKAQRLNLAVLDSLPGAVAILDPSGVVLRSNPLPGPGREPGGLPAHKLLAAGGSYVAALREAAREGPPEMKGAVSLLQEVLSKRSWEGVAESRGLAPGTWFELRAHQLELPEGGAFVSLVDVTPRRRAELEARQARDERAHLERVAAVGELGVSIAHELNQPLAAILTNAETAQRLLRRTPTDLSLLAEVLQDIVADDKRAGGIIRHMRALLKKGEARHANHDLNELVREVLRLVASDALVRGAELFLHLAEAHLPVHGDSVQLQQVVLNLTLNALDAVSHQPAGLRQVWVHTRRLEGHVELVVEDTGVGMTDETLQRLFEPFFTTKREGLGMGLSISLSILEVHQGRLQAERREGGGSLLRCLLPVSPSQEGDS